MSNNFSFLFIFLKWGLDFPGFFRYAYKLIVKQLIRSIVHNNVKSSQVQGLAAGFVNPGAGLNAGVGSGCTVIARRENGSGMCK